MQLVNMAAIEFNVYNSYSFYVKKSNEFNAVKIQLFKKANGQNKKLCRHKS